MLIDATYEGNLMVAAAAVTITNKEANGGVVIDAVPWPPKP